MTSSTEHSVARRTHVDQGATLKNYFAYEGSGVDPNIESHLNKIKATARIQATTGYHGEHASRSRTSS